MGFTRQSCRKSHEHGDSPDRDRQISFIAEGGRATTYGVYDNNENMGFVNVGTCADTGEFAVESIEKWRGKTNRHQKAEELQ